MGAVEHDPEVGQVPDDKAKEALSSSRCALYVRVVIIKNIDGSDLDLKEILMMTFTHACRESPEFELSFV